MDNSKSPKLVFSSNGILLNLSTKDSKVDFIGGGIEFGDWFSFYSQERDNKIIVQNKNLGSNSSFTNNFKVNLKLGAYDIFDMNYLDNDSFIKKIIIRNIKYPYSWLGDAVIRIVINCEEVNSILIENNQIKHENRNFYNDFETDQVIVKMKNGKNLLFSWIDHLSHAPNAFTRYIYVRDQPEIKTRHHYLPKSWVIHFRYLVDYPAAYVFRLARNPFVWWSKGILGRNIIKPEKLYKFWRAQEWKSKRRGQLQGLWPLEYGEEIALAVKTETTSL